MSIAIIQSGCANINSVRFAFERLGADVTITRDPEAIQKADKVVLPGVGAAAFAMESLREAGLDTVIPNLNQPVLGICLGMQLLYETSGEGEAACLGVLKGGITRFPGKTDLRVPHMGWNELCFDNNPLFKRLEQGTRAYFVHSFIAAKDDQTIATSDYGVRFTAAAQKDNFFGCQFHPERSGPAGQKILENFLRL